MSDLPRVSPSTPLDEVLNADFFNRLISAAGARPMAGLVGFTGPDFVAVAVKPTRAQATWYGRFETVPVTDVAKGPLAGANRWIVPKAGPQADDPDAALGAAVACDYIWAAVASGADPWLEVKPTDDGKNYVYPLECFPPEP